MKKLKEFLDLLVSFTKAWPIIISVLLLILSAIVGVSEFAGRSYVFSLPLWAVLFILALASYPIGKLIEFIVLRRKTPLKLVDGLLWKAPFFLIGVPTAICPRQGCGHEVICKEIPPPQFHLITPRSNDLQQANFEYSYQYECPIHGRIGGVPNEPLEWLQRKAMLIFNKKAA